MNSKKTDLTQDVEKNLEISGEEKTELYEEVEEVITAGLTGCANCCN